jgi:TRAP-type C4-dicarboxylate transport system substrate-binding protein
MRNLSALILAVFLVGCGNGATDEPVSGFGSPVTLTFGHPFPPTDPIQVNVWEPWVEEVRERTEGTVNIEIYAGGALGPGPSVYELVAGGAQDFGWTMPGYTPGRFPISQVIEAPFMFENAQQATEIAWKLWDEFEDFRAEYADVRPLAIWAMDTGDLFTRDRPVRTLEDISGLTIRAPSPLQNQALEAMGASPVSMPGPEIYDSVERGVIDGYKLANSATRVFDLGRATRYRTECHCYTGLFGPDLAMRLAGEHQAMADEVAREYWPAVGIETITLSDEEFGRWRGAVEPVFEQWIQEREADGVPGRMMATRMFQLNGQNP